MASAQGLSAGGLPAGVAICQKSVSALRRHYCLRRTWSRSRSFSHGPVSSVLTFLNLVQLILYIPLLALAGQGALYVLAGPKRDSNFFYQLLQLISKPFTSLMRRLTPAKVADQHVPIVTFFLLLVVYFVVTFERIDLCLKIGVEQCQ